MASLIDLVLFRLLFGGIGYACGGMLSIWLSAICKVMRSWLCDRRLASVLALSALGRLLEMPLFDKFGKMISWVGEYFPSCYPFMPIFC